MRQLGQLCIGGLRALLELPSATRELTQGWPWHFLGRFFFKYTSSTCLALHAWSAMEHYPIANQGLQHVRWHPKIGHSPLRQESWFHCQTFSNHTERLSFSSFSPYFSSSTIQWLKNAIYLLSKTPLWRSGGWQRQDMISECIDYSTCSLCILMRRW